MTSNIESKVEKIIFKKNINKELCTLLSTRNIYHGLKSLFKEFCEICSEYSDKQAEQDINELEALLTNLPYARGQHMASILKEALSLSPAFMKRLTDSAQRSYEKGFYRQASAAYLVCATLDPLNDTAWLGLGISEQKAQNYKKAVSMYKLAYQANPENPASHIYQAQCHIKLMDLDEAEKSLTNAMQGLWRKNNSHIYREHIHCLHKHISMLRLETL